MQFPVPVRRLFFRIAHRLLRISWLLRRPSSLGVKCLVTNEDRILLVRHTYGNRAWELPGGGVKRGEQPLDTARREMSEELGIESASWSELGQLRATIYHRSETVHCFTAGLASPEVTMDAGELATATWFDPTALPFDLGPYVLAILALAGIHPGGD